MASGTYPGTGGQFSPQQSTATEIYIHGGGAHLTTSSSSTPLIYASITITIRDVDLTGSAIPLQLVGPQSTLEWVTVHDTYRLVIWGPVVAHDLNITRSIDSTAAIALNGNGNLTLDRSTISLGTGGISAPTAGAIVHLSNVLIWGTSERALDIVGAQGDLTFSTIADSGASTSAAPCAARFSGVITTKASIIFQKGCASGPNSDAASGGTFQSSIVSNAAALPGTTNLDPQFISSMTHDYHLMSTSPAIDAVASGPDHDLDGITRPQGAAYDIGAYEYKP